MPRHIPPHEYHIGDAQLHDPPTLVMYPLLPLQVPDPTEDDISVFMLATKENWYALSVRTRDSMGRKFVVSQS